MPDLEVSDTDVSESSDTKKSILKKIIRPYSSKEKLMILFLAFVVAAVVTFITILGIRGTGATKSESRKICREVETHETTGKSAGIVNAEISVQDIALCHNLKCTFDTEECESTCPFSYELDENDCPVSCECAGEGIVEGDMAYDEADLAMLLEELRSTRETDDFAINKNNLNIRLWKREQGQKNGPLYIYYALDTDLTSEQQLSWKKAIKQIVKSTCIEMKEWKNEALDYLFVTKSESPDCTSFVGRKGGRQKIVMGNCYSANHAEHLLMHALGFQHEHNRYDREAFIEVKLENVIKEHRSKFKIIPKGQTLSFRTKFDVDSVTMFNGFAYSIDEETKPTILDIDTKQPIVVKNNGKFSKGDLMDINFMYCKGRLPGSFSESTTSSVGLQSETEPPEDDFAWTQWESWSHCDHTCGEAAMSRYRQCVNSAEEEATVCSGESMEIHDCKNMPCSEGINLKPKWSQWTEFGECSETCGTGSKYRTRDCLDEKVNGGDCQGSAVEEQKCNTEKCAADKFNKFDPWTQWTECSSSCDIGLSTRNRECRSIARKRARECSGFVENDGIQYQSKICNLGECPDGTKPKRWYSDSGASKDAEKPEWFIRISQQIPTSVCKPGSNIHWLTGDFNFDEKSDILCVEENGDAKIVLAGKNNNLDEIAWQGTLKKCVHELIYTGDFNGDYTTDIMCVAVYDTETDILIFPVRNGKPIDVVLVESICVDVRWKIYILDVNGDGKEDILCRDKELSPYAFSEIHLNVMDF